MVNIKEIKLMLIFTFLGAILGVFTLLQIDASILKQVIPILLIIIGFYFYFLLVLEQLIKKNESQL